MALQTINYVLTATLSGTNRIANTTNDLDLPAFNLRGKKIYGISAVSRITTGEQFFSSLLDLMVNVTISSVGTFYQGSQGDDIQLSNTLWCDRKQVFPDGLEILDGSLLSGQFRAITGPGLANSATVVMQVQILVGDENESLDKNGFMKINSFK